MNPALAKHLTLAANDSKQVQKWSQRHEGEKLQKLAEGEIKAKQNAKADRIRKRQMQKESRKKNRK